MWPAGPPPAVARRSSRVIKIPACLRAGSFKPRRRPKGLPPPPGPVRLEKGNAPAASRCGPLGRLLLPRALSARCDFSVARGACSL
ncbi:hypothetical protein NDU88_005252 [Pleurodeles waltl]|uniref:Uncharacterized protein n=1 Tax=Pleurodeles waltl TaxID=8319 RepID=A0AAV7PEU0_PLEWA|nr:hypothetical protein NDU88_005252 [Pleurodeles waltl]